MRGADAFFVAAQRANGSPQPNSDAGGASPTNPELLYSKTYLHDFLEVPDNRSYQNPIVLHQKYVLERASLAQIGKELLCSKSAVRRALVEADIPLRDGVGQAKLRCGVKFGTSVVRGRRVADAHELRVVETICALRQDGLSFDRIAARLTQLGIPTKTRRKKWNGGCVRAIFLKKSQSEKIEGLNG